MVAAAARAMAFGAREHELDIGADLEVSSSRATQ
jgi:hypothetical protein